GSDSDNRTEHVAQVAADGDFLHGVPDLASLDPVARRAARVVAGDQIHPEPDQLGHQKSATHFPDEPGKIELATPQDQIAIAARAAGGLHPELARGVAPEKIAPQHSVLDPVARARDDALAVVPGARPR